MSSLYSTAEIVRATGGRAENVESGAIGSISIDSREIEPGALFVAIRGENFDGHDFVAEAIETGAAAALVSEERSENLKGLPLVIVPDALAGLYDLARYSRMRSSALIVGVTGSVGKTSTKETLAAIFRKAGKTHASIRSFNNHWGVPLMVARMPQDTEFAVFEMGMSAPGEIGPLARLVRPHGVIITAIAPAHIEHLGSLEAIADAKAEIFEGLEPDGFAVLNADHGQFERLEAAARGAKARTLTYGFAPGADYRLKAFSSSAFGAQARLVGGGLDIVLSVGAPARHVLANSAGALLVAREMGVAPEVVLDALSAHQAPEGRGVVTRLGPAANPLLLLDESYNANPTSMRAALELFGNLDKPAGKKILVLGEMRELGEGGLRHHGDLADVVLGVAPDRVFLVGPLMAALAEKLPAQMLAGHAESIGALENDILAALAFGDSVMVKGSNGVRLGSLVSRIRAHFAPE